MAAFAAGALAAVATFAPAQGLAAGMKIPVEYHKLDNGLRVVLSPDSAVPTTTVAVYYGIGFRIEPKGRTGFAHLFEHMMFQGSKNLGKAEFIALVNQNGGVLNGSTRFDFTNYFQIVPSNKTETFIWAEADRMRSLDITQENLTNQQGVVKNEVKVNVLNQPYGGFPWLDLPQLANTNWYNAHNFYGDLAELDAATLDDVKKFFNDFYAPNNAVLVVAGDIDTKQTLGWVKKYFGDIPAAASIPKPDISEPKQTAEKRLEKVDRLAPQPAIGWAYHVPQRDTPEWYAMVMLDYILLKGEDSRLNQKLVQEKGYGSFVTGGINWPLGNIWNYNGPILWTGFMIHGGNHAPDAIINDLTSNIEDLQKNLVSAEELARARTKLKSDLYDTLGDGNRFGLVDTLASFALFHDKPQRINGLEKEFDGVTPELIRQVARDYLRTTNRSIITLKPGATPPAPVAKGK
jgi:predicted Zn-dependent peptidase